MEMLWVYLMMQADSITGGLIALCMILAGITAFLCVCAGDSYYKNEQSLWIRRAKLGAGFTVTCFLLVMLLPSTKTIAAMAATSVVMDVAKTDAAKRMANKSVMLLEQLIDTYTKKESK